MQTIALSSAATILLTTRVDSVEKLELLAALARADEQRSTILDLARSATLPASLARRLACDMDSTHVVELSSRGAITLAGTSTRDRAAIEEVIEMYRRYPSFVLRVLEGHQQLG